MSEARVAAVAHLDLRFAPWAWPFADARRPEIDAHFASLRRHKPALFNGRVMMLRDLDCAGGTIRGAAFETDYAAMLAWDDWGQPDQAVYNFFGLAALRAADGAYLLAVMGTHTANAGHVYFPSGTPDREDVVGDAIDLHGSVLRELEEETGLTVRDVDILPGWHAVFFRRRLALMKRMTAHGAAGPVRARILDFLGRETDPELADIRIVRGPADIDPNMPPFVTAFLEQQWRSA